MDRLWSWTAPNGVCSSSPLDGAGLLITFISNEKEPTERRVRAVNCLDVLQDGLPDGYDSLHETLQIYAVPLLKFLSTIPSSSSTPQPLLQYLLTLPKVLTCPDLPSSFSSLQLIHPSEALQVLAELVELDSWSSAHVAPLSLALFYATQQLTSTDELAEQLLSAPMTGFKVIAPGRSFLGVLGRVAKHLNKSGVDRGLAAIASRELSQVYRVLLGRSSNLTPDLAESGLRAYLSVVINISTLPKDTVSHVPKRFVWTALQHLVAMERDTHDQQTAGRVADLIMGLVQRPSLGACDLPSEAMYPLAYDICQLLADAQVDEERARLILEKCQRSPLFAACLQDVASIQMNALARDAQELPIALAISRADGSNYELPLAITQIRQSSWAPILRAFGHDVTRPLVISPGTQQVTESYLLALLAPDLAKSLLPASNPLPFNTYVPPSNTASAYSGKVYTQQEFRAARYVKGQSFIPLGYGPQANQLSQSSRAPSRHVDDFIM